MVVIARVEYKAAFPDTPIVVRQRVLYCCQCRVTRTERADLRFMNDFKNISENDKLLTTQSTQTLSDAASEDDVRKQRNWIIRPQTTRTVTERQTGGQRGRRRATPNCRSSRQLSVHVVKPSPTRRCMPCNDSFTSNSTGDRELWDSSVNGHIGIQELRTQRPSFPLQCL